MMDGWLEFIIECVDNLTCSMEVFYDKQNGEEPQSDWLMFRPTINSLKSAIDDMHGFTFADTYTINVKDTTKDTGFPLANNGFFTS